MAFPFSLLLGAAALILVGGKKKKKSGSGGARPPADTGAPAGQWKAFTPPPGDKSRPIITKPPATPSKPPDLRPFTSVKQFQEALNALGFQAGRADNSWGKNTSGAISTFQDQNGLDVTGVPDKETLGVLYQKSYGKPGASECDPLDPSSLPPGHGCFDHNGRFVALPLDMSALPIISEGVANQSVIFSPDLTNIRIGVQWRYAVLEKWLAKQKTEGKVGLSGTKKTLEWITENLVRAPSKFLGAGNETVGGIIYAILIIIATRGAASKYFTSLFGASRAAVIGGKAIVWLGVADGVAGGLGLFNMLLAPPKELLEAQMMSLLNAFAEDHKVMVGNELVSLKDLPIDAPAVEHLLRKMMGWVGKFQRYQYD